MITPGYYSTSYRAMSVRDLARMRGWLRLPLTYWITRFKKPSAAAWMPQRWAELECKETDLSAECLQTISSARETFKRLEFKELGFKKLGRVLNPLYRDAGGINFLDRTRRHFGQLLYVKLHAPPRSAQTESKSRLRSRRCSPTKS